MRPYVQPSRLFLATTAAALALFAIITVFHTSFRRIPHGALVPSHPSASVGGRQYTYDGYDYPQTWILPPLARVHLSHEDSVHYALDTPLGVEEWNTTLPTGGAVIHLGASRRTFTVAMFHEIRCLNILREVLVAFYKNEEARTLVNVPDIAKHCMNYLRQMVLCRADSRLESIRSPTGSKKTVSEITHECKDWTAVFAAAEDNYREYKTGFPL